MLSYLNSICGLFFLPWAILFILSYIYGTCFAIYTHNKRLLFFSIVVGFFLVGNFLCHFSSSRYMLIWLVPAIAYMLYIIQGICGSKLVNILIGTIIIGCAFAGGIKSLLSIKSPAMREACMEIQTDAQNYRNPIIVNLTKEKEILEFQTGLLTVDDPFIKPEKSTSHNHIHRLLQRYQYMYDAIYFVFWVSPTEPDFTAEEFCLAPSQWIKLFRKKTKTKSLDLCIFRYTSTPLDYYQNDFSLPLSTRATELSPVHQNKIIDQNFYIIESNSPDIDQISAIVYEEHPAIRIQSPTQAGIRTYPMDLFSSYRLDFSYKGIDVGGFLEVALIKVDLPTKKIYKDETIAKIPLNDLLVHRITLFLWRDMVCRDEYARLLFRVKPGNVVLWNFSFAPVNDAPQCDFDH